MSTMIRTTLSIAAALALFASAVAVAQDSGTDTYNASSGGEAKTATTQGTLQGTLSAGPDVLLVAPATADATQDRAAASGGAPANASYDPSPRATVDKVSAAAAK